MWFVRIERLRISFREGICILGCTLNWRDTFRDFGIGFLFLFFCLEMHSGRSSPRQIPDLMELQNSGRNCTSDWNLQSWLFVILGASITKVWFHLFLCVYWIPLFDRIAGYVVWYLECQERSCWLPAKEESLPLWKVLPWGMIGQRGKLNCRLFYLTLQRYYLLFLFSNVCVDWHRFSIEANTTPWEDPASLRLMARWC